MKSFKPRPYQVIAIRHIIDHPKSALFLFMGAGKSAATLSAFDALSLADPDLYPALIIAPLRVANSVWPEEIKKWQEFSHMRMSVITGAPEERQRALRTPADIYVTNYETLPWLVQQLGDKWPFKTIVADELTRLKSYRGRYGSVRARALAQMCQLHCKRFIGLTGTPAPNGLKDIWGQLFFCDGGERLGRTYTSFTQRWFRPTWDGFGLEPLAHAQKEIQERISDICLSVDPKDHFDLKEPIETNVYVDLPQKARALYRQMEKDMFMEIERAPIEAFNAASRTNKCSQLASGAVYFNPLATSDDDHRPGVSNQFKIVHEEKLYALDEIVAEWSGHPILVVYNFRSDLVRLLRRYSPVRPETEKHNPNRADYKVTCCRALDKNPQTIKDWNDGKIPLLFAHPASAGHGLNLARGSNIIVFFGLSWNMEEHTQIIERIGPVRQLQEGFDRNVFIYRILARDTIDEDMLERLKSKESVQNVLLKAMKRRK